MSDVAEKHPAELAALVALVQQHMTRTIPDEAVAEVLALVLTETGHPVAIAFHELDWKSALDEMDKQIKEQRAAEEEGSR